MDSTRSDVQLVQVQSGEERAKKYKKRGERKRKNACGQTEQKVVPSIPGSGIPSDWSILTDFVNTSALLTQMRYAIRRRSETFQRVTQCSNL